MKTKICIRCQFDKPLEDYYIHRVRKDGRSSRCRACEKVVKADWWQAKKVIDPASAVEFARLKYLNGRKVQLAFKRKRYAENPKLFNEKSSYYRQISGEKYNAAQREIRATNPDAVLAKQRAYVNANRARYCELSRNYRERNLDVCKQRSRDQYRKHIDKRKVANARYYRLTYEQRKPLFNAKSRARSAAKLNATPSWMNKFFIAQAYELAVLRTKMLGFQWEVDHIVPLRSKTVCGLHVEHNLQVIPKRINRSKGNKYDQNNAIGFIGLGRF